MEDRNYGRFYGLLRQLPYDGDRDELKRSIVFQYTSGRTESLRDMTDVEYSAMCSQLEERSGWKSELKKKRSVCLRLMQQLGVDTTDWGRVNAFCLDSRIAGCVFAKLRPEGLDALQVKLRAIKRNGGLKPKSHGGGQICYMVLPIGNGGEA